MVSSAEKDLDRFLNLDECSPTNIVPGDEHVSATWQPGIADFADFSTFIPRYSKQHTPCDYCRSKQLECFVIYEGGQGCASCIALFRQCSLTHCNASLPPPTHIDILHVVDEDVTRDFGDFTSTKPLLSNNVTADKTAKRFSKSTLAILKNWIDSHADNPYPTDKEREELKLATGLNKSQISTWMANARRRRRFLPVKLPVLEAPSSAGSQPMDIPGKPYALMNPLERWKMSPPEHEPATVSDIARAVAATTTWDKDKPQSNASSRSHSRNRASSSSASTRSGCVQVTSADDSASSHGTSWSYGSKSTQHSLVRKSQRRRRRPTLKKSPSEQSVTRVRPFQCTFCTDTFASKYDWVRHEKSLHLSLETWTCAPLGPIVPAGQHTECVFCGVADPSMEHVDAHHYRSCRERGPDACIFYRKDHLRQHLRLVHEVTFQPNMSSWKSERIKLRSRCGFCSTEFDEWQARTEHLARHFRDGAKIADWHGDWGFEAEVAALVTNSIPPFMIGDEAKTLDPFSASDFLPAPGLQPDGALPHQPLTCYDVLEMQLGLLVQQCQSSGRPVTDKLLQDQARQLIYGSTDGWDQTAADHPEWLGRFKRAHGLHVEGESASGDVVQARTVGFKSDSLLGVRPYGGAGEVVLADLVHESGRFPLPDDDPVDTAMDFGQIDEEFDWFGFGDLLL